MIMTIAVKKTSRGIFITDRFVFNPTEIQVGIINLKAIAGEAMAYDRSHLLCIDFPGDYDIGGTWIQAFLGKGDRLNYLISYQEEEKEYTFGIIQSQEILELDEFSGMDVWFFYEDSINKKLDQMEIDGERVDFDHLPLED
ncbi:MAG: hypothetical protein PHR46_02260 [Candidatus Absconditabacteria bacterium]|nr:hypothetical protein [Candidatus Absconditabacteria bacterium]